MGGPCLSKAVGRKTVGTRVTAGTIAGTRTTGGYDLAVTDFLTDARIPRSGRRAARRTRQRLQYVRGDRARVAREAAVRAEDTEEGGVDLRRSSVPVHRIASSLRTDGAGAAGRLSKARAVRQAQTTRGPFQRIYASSSSRTARRSRDPTGRSWSAPSVTTACLWPEAVTNSTSTASAEYTCTTAPTSPRFKPWLGRSAVTTTVSRVLKAMAILRGLQLQIEVPSPDSRPASTIVRHSRRLYHDRASYHTARKTAAVEAPT